MIDLRHSLILDLRHELEDENLCENEDDSFNYIIDNLDTDFKNMSNNNDYSLNIYHIRDIVNIIDNDNYSLATAYELAIQYLEKI